MSEIILVYYEGVELSMHVLDVLVRGTDKCKLHGSFVPECATSFRILLVVSHSEQHFCETEKSVMGVNYDPPKTPRPYVSNHPNYDIGLYYEVPKQAYRVATRARGVFMVLGGLSICHQMKKSKIDEKCTFTAHSGYSSDHFYYKPVITYEVPFWVHIVTI